MGSEVYFFVFDAQLGSNVVSMKLNGSGRQVAQFGDVIGGFALFDEIGHFNFSGGKSQIFAAQATGKWGHNIFEVGFDDVYQRFFPVWQFTVV